MTFTFKNFFNKILNSNRIFTREDVANMSSKDFQQNEKAIDYQLSNADLLSHKELLGRDDVVFVHGYERDDGTP